MSESITRGKSYTPQRKEAIDKYRKRHVIERVVERMKLNNNLNNQTFNTDMSYEDFLERYKSLPKIRGHQPRFTERDYKEYQYYHALKNLRMKHNTD